MSIRKNWLIILGIAIAAAIVLSFYFDANIMRFFLSLRTNYLDKFFLGVTFLDNEIFIAIFLTIILFLKKKDEWILPLWLTMALTALVSFILKITVHRLRPFMAGVITLLPGIVDKASYHIWDFSFPSFDSALVFCAIPVVSKFFPKFKYLWIAFSVLVALSRVYVGAHYLSDIISGAVIGFLLGVLVVKLESTKKFFKVIYKLKVRK